MSLHTHKNVNNVDVELTPEEIIELETPDPEFVPLKEQKKPTIEQLFEQLKKLTAQIEALK